MNANDSLERQLADFYESESPVRAPDWVLHSALQSIDDTPQRRVVIRVPWRLPQMNTFAKVAVAAVIVIAVGAVGLSVLRSPSSSNVGGQPTSSPTPSPSASFAPSPSITVASAPPLSGTFTSTRNGFSIAYPEGWNTRAGTDPGSTASVNFGSTNADVIYDPILQDHLFLLVTSEPLRGKTADQWMDDLVTALQSADECGPPITPVTIDGEDGQLCGGSAAVTSAGDRGYWVTLYTSGDDPSAVAAYDEAFFGELLATMQLQPENANDTPASPSTSPSS